MGVSHFSSWWNPCSDRFPADCHIQRLVSNVGFESIAPVTALFIAVCIFISIAGTFVYFFNKFSSKISLSFAGNTG